MATVGGIGVGLIVLAIVWVLCLFTCIALSRAQGAIAYAGIGAIILAVLVTIILWFFPRGPDPNVQNYVVYDNYFIPRVSLVTVAGFMFLLGLVFLVIFHVFDEQKATALRRMKAS